MNEIFAASVLAKDDVLAKDEMSAGVVGLLVVLGLIAMSTVLFVLLSKSLRRMRSNVATGEFIGVDADPETMRRLDARGRRDRSGSTVRSGRGRPVVDGEVLDDPAGAGAGAGAGPGGRLDVPTQAAPPGGEAAPDR